MSVSLQVFDETTSGEKRGALTLDFLTERITVRELIRNRVHQEVKDHNRKRNATDFHGLVQPTETERRLNGYHLRRPRQLDWQTQFAVATEAFERNGFLIVVDDRQVERLDDEIALKTGTRISFLKLVPLVGG